MSYEMFRSNVYSVLSDEFGNELAEKVINKIDIVAVNYDINPRTTDIIPYDQYSQVIKFYIASKSLEHLSAGTLRGYYSLLTRFFQTVRKDVKDIQANDIRAFLGRYKIERNVADSTLESKRIILHSFFLWCCEEGLITGNPCAHVLPIKFRDNRREPMDRDELEMMREACKDVREKALVEFLFSTGLRISEVAAMKFEDVDFAKRTVTVQHGKGDKKRISYINSKAMIALKKYIKTRADDCPYLFVNKRTKEKHGICKKSFQTEIHNIWLRTGMAHKVTPHIFRNTTGTISAQNGMPVEQVQKLLGHASIKTTMRYVKVFDEDVKNSHRKYTA